MYQDQHLADEDPSHPAAANVADAHGVHGDEDLAHPAAAHPADAQRVHSPHFAHVPGQAEWDERYAGSTQIWSGRPNATLVTEVAGLRPGRALDVGCGEGADAVWLAGQGWDVTALDVSQVALARAALHAETAGVLVRWLHAGLHEAALEPGTFDLVSAQYPALLHTPDRDGERALLGAVAPGGTLLVVHHADIDADEHSEHATANGFDPRDYVSPADVAELLDAGWRVEVDERRSRDVREGAGAHHALDVVLRARRLG